METARHNGNSAKNRAMPITLQDIAHRSRVSHTTVSKVLNGRKDAFISDGTRERVMAAAQELGYRPNRTARNLAMGNRRPAVALCTEYIHNSYASRMLHLIEKAAFRDNYDLWLRSSLIGATETRDGAFLMDLPVDGLLLFESVHLLDDLVAKGGGLWLPPVVTFGFHYSTETDYVAVDLPSGAAEAMEHLLDIGCRRIALLTPRLAPEVTDEPRCQAYREAMNRAGLPLEFIGMPSDPDLFRASAREAVRGHIAKNGNPDGLFCANDDMALGAYRGLCDCGLRVPEDVALIGCDGVEETEYLPTPITTIKPPYEQATATAWEFLKKRLTEPQTPKQFCILKPQLVIRESTQRR